MALGKNLIWICFVTLLVGMTIARVGLANPEIKIYADPKIIAKPPGESFDITVKASDVADLFLAEFYLSFDPAVLAVEDDPATAEIEGIKLGEVEPYLDKIWIERLSNAEGWLHVVAGRPEGVTEGLSGTVQIAKITFLVEAEGTSDLQFYDNPETPDTEPRLKDIFYNEYHTKEDGFFIYPSPDISITSVVASPSTATVGKSISITVTTKNEGNTTETFDVTVYYDNNTIGTQTVTNLGVGDDKSLTFTWDTTGVDVGTYTVKANATFVEGEVDTIDNIGTTTVKLQEGSAPVLLYALLAGIAVAVAAGVAVYVFRIRKPKPA